MSENNTYFEVIQNRLDTLVDKIIQKEQSDEDFRITYAQILEKINTKIDLFSNNDTTEEIKTLGVEIGQLMQSRQEIFDAKFAAIKAEFDNLNKLLFESLKTPELLAAFNKIQNQIHYLTDEQDGLKVSVNSVISHIENFGSLDETNTLILNDFAILNEQNSAIKNKLDEIEGFNKEIEIKNKKLIDDVSSVIFKIKELSEQTDEKADDTKTFIADRIDSVITKIHESDSSIEILNNNLNTLIEVVGNIFEDEAFEDLKTDVAEIISKAELLSEAVKQIATKEELSKTSSQNKEDIKNYSLKLITELESNIFSKLNVEDIANIKDYTEKIFFQGTEVLKEEIWNIKDVVKTIDSTVVKKDEFQKQVETVKNNITDVVTDRQKSTSQQIKEVSEQIETLKEELTDFISEESVATSQQIKEVSESITELKEDVTDIISEESVAAAQQIKEISENINLLKEDINDIISEKSTASTEQIKQLANAIENLKTDINKLVLDEQGQQIEIALQNLQTKFVTQLVQIADNISFEEQSDEINDNILMTTENTISCINDNTDKLLSSINKINDNVEKLNNDTENNNATLLDNIGKLDESLKADISEKIKEFTKQLKILTNGLNDDENYTYTLPDVESDIAKIRFELTNLQKVLINPDSLTEDYSVDIATRINDLKSAVQKMQESPITQEVAEIKDMFGGLTEDISSISKRTNKLIISSDEVNKKLLSNITAFTSLINAFEKQSKSFYNSAFLKDIYKKVDVISKGTEALINSNQAVNEAFVYMGEWIDTASDSFDNIQNDITKIKKNLLSSDENISDKFENAINSINQRLDEQENKINQIIAQQAETQEIKSLLEYVASQVSVTNEKIIENEQLTQKILSMEKQLKKIEKNIAIITEYIDDDDNYDE